MTIWNDDDWPMNIRKKDEEQKQFHKAASSTFFLLLDGNDRTLPLDTMRELCQLADQRGPQRALSRPDGVSPDVFDEDCGHMLDVFESLKSSLCMGTDEGDETGADAQQLIAEISESLTAREDDFDVPLFRVTERRSTKPS